MDERRNTRTSARDRRVLMFKLRGYCSASDYCPGDVTSRAQMPIFLLEALEGPDYTPPTCLAGGPWPFDDVGLRSHALWPVAAESRRRFLFDFSPSANRVTLP